MFVWSYLRNAMILIAEWVAMKHLPFQRWVTLKGPWTWEVKIVAFSVGSLKVYFFGGELGEVSFKEGLSYYFICVLKTTLRTIYPKSPKISGALLGWCSVPETNRRPQITDSHCSNFKIATCRYYGWSFNICKPNESYTSNIHQP